jgi:hypothetical protein
MTEPATTAPPAATPPPSAKPAEPSTLDARVKLASEMTKRPVFEEAKSDDASGTGEDDTATADSGAAVAGDDEGVADGEATDSSAAEGAQKGVVDEGPVGTADERLTLLGEALAKYDLAAIKKALPEVKIPEKLEREFRALDRRQRKVTKQESDFTAAKTKASEELSQESQRVSNQQRQLIQQFKPAVDGKKAWEDQDYVGVAKALEKQFGTDIATITQKLATGKTGMTPAEKAENSAIAELRKELADLKAQKTDESKQQTQAQKRQTAVTKVGEALKTHPFVTDEDAVNEVFAEYEKSWNGEKFTKTPKQVADELQAKVVARAKKLGLAPAPVAKTVTKPVTKAPPKRLPEPPRGGKTAQADDFEARIALAQRAVSVQRRGLTGK